MSSKFECPQFEPFSGRSKLRAIAYIKIIQFKLRSDELPHCKSSTISRKKGTRQNMFPESLPIISIDKNVNLSITDGINLN